jgi:Skp family chaperone for outer membrane proteins
MNNAHIKSRAVSGDHRGVQSFVRRFAACCLVGVAAMSVAQAGPRERQRDAQEAPQRTERAQRQDEERQQRRDEEQRRNQQIQQDQQNAQNNADAFRRSGRLTPDERRDLRRQINEAGADIYPNRRR